MYADLNAAGTTPADRDALTRRCRNGTSSLEHSLRSHVEIGSIRQSTHGCGDIVVCDLLDTREDTVSRREARCCGARSRRTNIGDFLVEKTVEIPGADVVATL